MDKAEAPRRSTSLETTGVETQEMDRNLRYRFPRLALVPVLLALSGGTATNVNAQAAERFKVLVPRFTSQTDRSNFGKDVANEFVKLLRDFATHRPVDNGNVKDALKEYDLKEEQLGENGCLFARQLALQIDVNLVMCGTYTGEKDNYTVQVNVIAPAESETYALPPFQAVKPKDGAQTLATEFEAWIEGLKVASFCSDYVDSQQWSDALRTCSQAVEVSPSKGTIYLLSYAKWQSGDLEGAYAGFKNILEIEALHQESIKALGILATEMGNPDEGMQYFRDYMSLNPGDWRVRLAVATDAAKADQYEAALGIVEDGITGEDANNIDLLQAAGVYAMNAANQKVSAAGGTVEPEAGGLFETALAHLDKVYQEKGAEMDVGLVRNIVQANRLLERNADAIAFAAQVTAEPAYADDPGLWSAYADALNKAGQMDEAFAALDKAESIDPDYAVYARRASWMLDAGDVAGAVPAMRKGVERGELSDQQADVLAQKIAVTAFNEKAKVKQHQAALNDYEVAEEFASSDAAKQLVAFFKGYSIYEIAVEREKPETLQTAQATLPMFQRVVRLMNEAAGNSQVAASRQQILDAANQYIEIQQAIIKRGR